MPLGLLIENVILTQQNSFTIEDLERELRKQFDDNIDHSIDIVIYKALDSYINDGIVYESQGQYNICV